MGGDGANAVTVTEDQVDRSGRDVAAVRRPGISAFVRCKNEEEYIVASLMSIHRIFDEIVVILNNSTDRTRELVTDLMTDHLKIRLVDYESECAPTGPGYLEAVRRSPQQSLARYYNWCLEQTTYSHVCKWDGDMVALPSIAESRAMIHSNDVVIFDGYDVLDQYTTDYEPRIFRYDPSRAKYVDWDLYEVLAHDYSRRARIDAKCYLHMKLVKRDWIHRAWVCPNEFAAGPVPAAGSVAPRRTVSLLRELSRRALQALGVKS
jgi:glycosyltransferase involved in cell wall biosynthesis